MNEQEMKEAYKKWIRPESERVYRHPVAVVKEKLADMDIHNQEELDAYLAKTN